LKRIGGSLTISIPKAMVRALDLSPNERVRVLLTDRGLSIVKKR
jgi:antitoxin component of MazEF toxin-antitoxin module